MKKLTLFIAILTIIVMSCSILMADDQAKEEDWRNVFRLTLEEGKPDSIPQEQTQSTGPDYTPEEEAALRRALKQALAEEKGERVCDCMKIAIIEQEYSAFLVMKTIYEVGGSLEIDQLCMCATEAGVMKAVHAQAAEAALSPSGEKMYSRDEVTQANCFRGLAYTFDDQVEDKGIEVGDGGDNNNVSNYKPQSG